MNGETTMNKLLAIAAPAALMAGGLAAVVAVAGPAGTDSRAASGKTPRTGTAASSCSWTRSSGSA